MIQFGKLKAFLKYIIKSYIKRDYLKCGKTFKDDRLHLYLSLSKKMNREFRTLRSEKLSLQKVLQIFRDT